MKRSKGNMKNENYHFSVPKTDASSVFEKSRMEYNEMTRLPTEKQCLNYFIEYKVPDNIFRHCCKVREVAVFLAEQLKEKKNPVNPVNVELVSCLAYFHDLCKMVVITDFGKNEFHKDAAITSEQKEFWGQMQKRYPGRYEGEVAYELFKDVYPELALSLRKVSSSKNENPTWEQMIVHYADLRVLREKIVTASERLAYLRQRYPRGDEIWNKHEQKIREQEQKIFSNLSFAPDQLAAEIVKVKRSVEVENVDKAEKIEKRLPMVQDGR